MRTLAFVSWLRTMIHCFAIVCCAHELKHHALDARGCRVQMRLVYLHTAMSGDTEDACSMRHTKAPSLSHCACTRTSSKAHKLQNLNPKPPFFFGANQVS
jgi:hypothetical protein